MGLAHSPNFNSFTFLVDGIEDQCLKRCRIILIFFSSSESAQIIFHMNISVKMSMVCGPVHGLNFFKKSVLVDLFIQ